jgi:hypothetical protein
VLAQLGHRSPDVGESRYRVWFTGRCGDNIAANRDRLIRAAQALDKPRNKDVRFNHDVEVSWREPLMVAAIRIVRLVID